MTIVKRNGNLAPQLPVLFDDFIRRDLFNRGISNRSVINSTIPAVNIKETANHYLVDVAAPGMQKEDFQVQAEGDVLTIRCEPQTSNDEANDVKVRLREFSYPSFSRSFNLPADLVDTENIQAKYQDGVLQVLIPKKEHARQQPPRLIPIS